MKNQVNEYKEGLKKQIVEKETELHELESIDLKIWEACKRSDDVELHNKQRNGWRRIEELKEFLEEAKLEVLDVQDKYFSECLFSDVHAFKCVKEYTPTKMGVVRMKVKIQDEAAKKLGESFVPGGFVGHTDNSLQKWDYEMPEYKDEDIVVIRKHKDGRWYSKRGSRFVLRNKPYEFYDYNF